jgi:hypothetical protein
MTPHQRMTDTLMRGVGGRSVLLHLPAPAIPGDLGEQLGLATPPGPAPPTSPTKTPTS